jgi:dephospho-CoA kinase
MGLRNYRIDGVSCSGKTTVGKELRRRGYQVIDGDDELAYWDENRNWIWNVDKVRALAADHGHAVTFFCGGSRNSDQFSDLFDEVFVLDIDLDTLNRRLAARPPNEWGGTASEGEAFARRQQETREGLPLNAFRIDATAPLTSVVDTILKRTGAAPTS